MEFFENQAREIERTWENDSRWRGIKRDYNALEVARLRGTVKIEYSLARMGA